MKIALVYEKFISRGGLEKYLYSFANQLVKKGHNLAIVTAETDSETSQLDHAEFCLIPRRTLRQFSRGAEEAVAQLRVDASIGFGRTVAHDLHRAGGGCHRFYSEHVLHPLKRSGAKNLRELALERELYTSGKTRHFVVNSQMVSDQLQNAYSINDKDITVIYTAIDTNHFRPPPPPDSRHRLRDSIPDGAEIFLFVSMNHRRKGLDALLAAWPMVPNSAQLWVVGPELAPRYRRTIQRSGLEGRVRNFVQPPDLVPYYQAADFFIHPTRYDACANTVLQAMACGLPGLISCRDGARQFIAEGQTGMLLPHPTEPDEIALKAKEMMALSRAERTQIGGAARQRTLELTWQTHVSQWETLIARVAEGRS